MKFEYIFWLIFAAILGNFAWRYFRNGRSFTGAFLGGHIKKEIGEVVLAKGAASSQVLRVLAMQTPEGEKFIGMSVVSKAPLAASMVPYKLTPAQAQELISLLQQAAYE